MGFEEYQIKQLEDVLTGGAGVLIILGAIFLLIAAASVTWMRWPTVTFLLFVSSLGAHIDQHLFSPLQEFATYGRSICVVLLVVLVVISLRAHQGWRPTAMLNATIAFAVYEIVCNLRTLLAGQMMRGLVGTLIFLLIFFAMGAGLGRQLQTVRDAEKAILCVVFAGLLICVTTLMQYMINSSQVIETNRLIGVSDNANHMAALLAVCILPQVYFFLRSETSYRNRVILTFTISTMIVMLVWTGSRTGLVMMLAGFGMLLRRRLGTGILLMFGVCIGGLLVWQLVDPGEGTAMRIVSTDNTRMVVWTSLLSDFVSNPVIGTSEQTSSENSYLLVAARAGVVGLAPFVISLVMLLQALRRVQRLRHSTGSASLMCDFVLAASVSLLIGGFFEGFLYGTLNVPVLALYVYMAVSAFLLDYGIANQSYDQMPVEEDGENEQEEEDGAYGVPAEQVPT